MQGDDTSTPAQVAGTLWRKAFTGMPLSNGIDCVERYFTLASPVAEQLSSAPFILMEDDVVPASSSMAPSAMRGKRRRTFIVPRKCLLVKKHQLLAVTKNVKHLWISGLFPSVLRPSVLLLLTALLVCLGPLALPRLLGESCPLANGHTP